MKIDQIERIRLMRLILSGDDHAQVHLASLYWNAGYLCMSDNILKATRTQMRRVARNFLKGLNK